MKKIRLLIILSVCCLSLCPDLVFAESADEAPVQVSQPSPQTIEEQPSSSEAADGTPVQGLQPDSKTIEAQKSSSEMVDETADLSDYSESDESSVIISDPLEPINRVFFIFNDKLYFWVLKPIARGYKVVAPEPVRVGVKNFFSNLSFPIRFINCLLQAKFTGAGVEFERFFVNSTLGVAGFINMADREFGTKEFDEDFGQTLGSYGLGNGFYLCWPFFGPSSALETVGLTGDYFLDPTYNMKFKHSVTLKGCKTINNNSLTLGDYETLKKSALDPYVAFRDFYIQYRKNQIKE
jgi:phospholipid-binding lipoprotein MlaA